MRSGGKVRRVLSLTISCALIVSIFGALPLLAATATSSSAVSSAQTPPATATALSVTMVPPKLSADGGSYPAVVVSLETAAGAPSIALNQTTVFLSSSVQGVGTVSSKVTIPSGAGFAVASLTTTTTAGTSTISASSVGLTSSSAPVTTVVPSGLATRLNVIPVPGAQLADPNGIGTIIVETLDSQGDPAEPSAPVLVTLSSSNNAVVTLPLSSLILGPGSVLDSVAYDLGSTPGVSEITGSASGYFSGSGAVNVEGDSPTAFSISAQPDPVATSSTGQLVVGLVDTDGKPAAAPGPIAVTIASSNTTNIAIAQTVTIGAGQIYAVVPFSSGSHIGSSNLTILSSGLKSAFSFVTVMAPVAAARLALVASPNPVLANRGTYASLVVSLTGATGQPAVASSTVSVTLDSSDSAVGNVTANVEIPAGSSYGVANFESSFLVGSTTITASTQNLQSASSVVTSYGTTPTSVVVAGVPSTLPADGGEYAALAVMLEGSPGQPAVAPVNISVAISSSNTAIIAVNSTVVIPAGQSYVLDGVTTTTSPGSANITAASSGFTSSSIGFQTTSTAPTELGFYAAPTNGVQGVDRGDGIVAVQLQSSGGNPTRATQATQVLVTSSTTAVMAKPLQLTIPAGNDYAWAYINATGPGTAVLTASTSGIAAATATISETILPVTVTLTASQPVISINGVDTLVLQVEVLGSPIQGAAVTLTAPTGILEPPTGTTDATGEFTSAFVPFASGGNGESTVVASVTDQIFGNQSASTPIFIGPTGGTSTGHGLGELGVVLPIVIVAVIVVILVFGIQRTLKGRREATEEVEEGEVE